MHFLRECLLLICVIWMPVGNAVCPDSTPYSCGLSECHNYEQYCNSEGEVKSCFPNEMSANETAILEWCQGPNKRPHPQCMYACKSKFGERYSDQDGRPDLKYFVDAKCNESKPHKCPPYAKCYNFEQYCTSEGEVESCFPPEISANDTAILQWCKRPDSSSKLTHPTCKFACNAIRDRYAMTDQVTSSTVNTVTNSTSKDSTSCDCQGEPAESKDNTTLIALCISILLVCVAILAALAVIIWCFVRERPPNQTCWRRFICWTRDTGRPADGTTQEGEHMLTPPGNAKKGGEVQVGNVALRIVDPPADDGAPENGDVDVNVDVGL